MEEIDIIELLKREKERKAPKVIEIKGTKFYSSDTENDIEKLYLDDCGNPWFTRYIDVQTKIKILDKPFIEELPTGESTILTFTDLADKINEIIRYLRSKDER